jgi:hypothetical protein
MKALLGYVLVKETNQGIPGLVVAAYDSEKTIDQIFVPDHGRDRGAQLPPGTINHLGKRLGSVLTNDSGRFLLTSEDLKFEGNEARPDLLLAVFAPEDVQGLNKPYPLPPEQRILYISNVPRDDAGSEESYVIRLLQSQLDQFRIPTNSSQNHGESESLRLRNAIERTFVFHENFKAAVAPRLKAQVAAANKVNGEIAEKFKNFSSVPPELREHPLLISDPSELKEKHSKVISEGMARLQQSQGSMQVSVSREALDSLGLRLDRHGEIVGNLKSASLLELIKQATSSSGGLDLIRIRDLNDKSVKEAYEFYTAEKSKGPPEDNGH